MIVDRSEKCFDTGVHNPRERPIKLPAKGFYEISSAILLAFIFPVLSEVDAIGVVIFRILSNFIQHIQIIADERQQYYLEELLVSFVDSTVAEW
jgi:hypothetical protein